MRENLDEAQSTYEKALSYAPADSNTLYNLGCLHNSKGDKNKAISYFELCLQIDSDNKSATHLLSSLKGENTNIAPQSYIADLFDEYAPSFEASLKGKLQYEVPLKLYNLLLKHVNGKMPTFEHMLDLGCGTGLGGKEFSKKVHTMTGVDLSSAMLQVAEAHKIYNNLHCLGISDFLNINIAKYDLFLASDVFIYIGDLSCIFKGAYQAAADNAYFLFSIELLPENGPYKLLPSGRYAHTESYIHSLAENFQWQFISSLKTNIRKDHGEWIKGMIVLLKKS